MAEQTGAPIVGTSDDDFDALVEGASLPEQAVRLCLDGKLRREYEEVKDRIDKRDAARNAAAAAAALGQDDVRLSSKAPAAPEPAERDPEQDRLDELVEKMRAKLVTFIVRALPSTDYNLLLQAHPPRKDATTGRIDPRDYNGYNSATFVPALVRACIAAPTMTDARWAKLEPVLTDAQFDRLWTAAAEVNRRDEDIPF
ncbi:hypothetical protein ACIBTV_27400 [Micromonospora sp. NPDC049366]|uniref:hypothetical protein n=1 Tax=Micromonospora sp. NPDC049366 TaxID=3364271 RepID=UPI0037A9556C